MQTWCFTRMLCGEFPYQNVCMTNKVLIQTVLARVMAQHCDLIKAISSCNRRRRYMIHDILAKGAAYSAMIDVVCL